MIALTNSYRFASVSKPVAVIPAIIVAKSPFFPNKATISKANLNETVSSYTVPIIVGRIFKASNQGASESHACLLR